MIKLPFAVNHRSLFSVLLFHFWSHSSAMILRYNAEFYYTEAVVNRIVTVQVVSHPAINYRYEDILREKRQILLART